MTAAISATTIMCSMLLVLVSVTLCELTDEEKTTLQKYGEVKVTEEGDYYVIESDGTPHHDTANFPTNYNPNSIKSHDHKFYIPKNPECQKESKCLNMGPIGVSLSGVPFFSPFTNDGFDAVTGAHKETFDACDGHPERQGQYHYHKEPSCIAETRQTSSEIIGLAFDGFPIYNKYKQDGTEYTSADLDKCHGRTTDGKYRYHVTADYPYILGCYRGKLHISIKAMTNMPGCKKAEASQAASDDTCGAPAVMSLSAMSTALIMMSIYMLIR